MSGDVEAGSPRPRPLSGGFWTLLSWLRREEHSSSNESLSSAGSDRTAVSFAFLTPAHYHGRGPPIVLPPPGPPTDTYKNRVRDRNLRRQYDRDLTLHRKYGLYRGEGVSGYDAFSLPPARRCSGAAVERQERERRATSECCQRRAAHVPGKRRAPPPPARLGARPAILEPTLSVGRRHTRKRRAPQPPCKITENFKENTLPCEKKTGSEMSVQPARQDREPKCNDVSEPECKSEKYTKKESKESKVRSEKSFLKQIFENKKRNSAVDISAVKLLPNISELDKQAAEIIESTKLRKSEEIIRQQKANQIAGERAVACSACKGSCICNKSDCLPLEIQNVSNKKASTIYTQTENVSMVKKKTNSKIDEKQMLKDMLKEMKDSLPKRPKHTPKDDNSPVKLTELIHSGKDTNIADNTPTLRIGSSNLHQDPIPVCPSTSTGQPVQAVLLKLEELPNRSRTKVMNETQNAMRLTNVEEKPKTFNSVSSSTVFKRNEDAICNKPNHGLNDNKILNTPLKISSLLNPMYVPKNTAANQHPVPKTVSVEVKLEDKEHIEKASPSDPIYVKTADTVRDIILNSAISVNANPNKSCKPMQSSRFISKELSKHSSSEPQNEINMSNLLSQKKDTTKSSVEKLSEHARRRELVCQLEQSIAKGDERAAADAASKLAQLRLSCSVLSFTSQILTEPSTSKIKATDENQTKNKHPQVVDIKDKPLETRPVILKADIAIAEKDQNEVISNKIYNEKGNTNKINSDLVKASSSKESSKNVGGINMAKISVWIEDKEKARGPISLNVRRQAVVGELRRQAELSLGLPARLQRWIIGRSLCTDDTTPLASIAGPALDAPFYLCLVESETKAEANAEHPKKTKAENENNDAKVEDYEKKAITTGDVYSELVKLDRQAIVPNSEIFECEICMEQCNPGDGAVLRECVHSFCKGCLAAVVRHCEEAVVSCPARGCAGLLQGREVRALVSRAAHERWLARGLAAAESGARGAFHCRTRDCAGWALCEPGVRRFPCPVCKHSNCIPCQAIHENETCEQYRAKLIEAAAVSSTNQADEGTQALIESLIKRGEALQCPECRAVITKKWGCDWVKCAACKTEICWVTRGRRWGPAGRGDASAGCRCGVDGKKCHPACAYCH